MFTDVDVAHMKKLALDLSDYATVKGNAAVIRDHLRGADGTALMPPVTTSGPWPEEWIALFERWISEGCTP